jgi:hypothetical protein
MDDSSIIAIAIAIGSLIVTAISVLVAVAAAGLTYISSNRQFEAMQLTARRDEIYKKLNEFYGPFMQLRKKSLFLHERFKNGKDFRTLTQLLEGVKYDGNDKVILDEILRLGKECEDLIEKKAGLIDEPELRSKHLPNATRHFFIIRNAAAGIISGEVDRFKNDTFPRDIDDIVKSRIDSLQEELKDINKKMLRFI